MLTRFIGATFIAGLILAVAGLSGSTALASNQAKSKVLYKADFRRGTTGWHQSSGGWSVAGGLLNYGGSGSSTFVAPYAVHKVNYALESTIRLARWTSDHNHFGILFRANGPVDLEATTTQPGLLAGIWREKGILTELVVQEANIGGGANVYNQNLKLDPGYTWHTYRVNVKGNTIHVYVDGHEAFKVESNISLLGTRVGVFSSDSQLQIKSFKVLAL